MTLIELLSPKQYPILFQRKLNKITFAQIQDGLPFAEVVADAYSDLLLPNHPIFKHTELSPKSLDDFRASREGCDVQLLQFDILLLNAFQAASLG